MAVHPAYDIRPATGDELPALFRLVNSVFLEDFHDDELEHESQNLEPERSVAVFDGGQPVGSGAIYTRDLTVPGGPIPVAAVTWVAVSPTHRRRGLLTAMMREQLHGLHDQVREPVAVLWASEAAIYGRFGYGLAARGSRLTVATDELALRAEVDRGTGTLRQLSGDEALPEMKAVYELVRIQRAGHLDRRDNWWNHRLFDPERWRDGASALRFVVHRDERAEPTGYAIFNVKGKWDSGPRGELSVRELAATTPAAYAAVLGYLIEMDLVRQLRWDRTAIDEPLIYLVDNPGGVRQEVFDALWVRLVDVDRALSARRYSVPIDVVLEISDDFCPWNAGRYRLTGDSDAAGCARTAEPADLAMSSTTLGAAYLGGTTLAILAAGGLVTQLRPGILSVTSAAFAASRQPSCPEVF